MTVYTINDPGKVAKKFRVKFEFEVTLPEKELLKKEELGTFHLTAEGAKERIQDDFNDFAVDLGRVEEGFDPQLTAHVTITPLED